MTGGIKAEGKGQRIPAIQIEALATDRIRAWLADPVALLNADPSFKPNVGAQKRLLDEAARLAATWQTLDGERLRAILRAVVRKVQVHADRVEMTIDQRAAALCLETKDQQHCAQPSEGDRDRHLTVLTIPARLKRAGIGMKMVVENGSQPANADAVLVRLLLRAHAIRARIIKEPGITLKEIAAEEGISSSYVTRLLRVAFLAPGIVTAIVNGSQPPQLTANRLMEDSRLPLDWGAQREFLSF